VNRTIKNTPVKWLYELKSRKIHDFSCFFRCAWSKYFFNSFKLSRYFLKVKPHPNLKEQPNKKKVEKWNRLSTLWGKLSEILRVMLRVMLAYIFLPRCWVVSFKNSNLPCRWGKLTDRRVSFKNKKNINSIWLMGFLALFEFYTMRKSAESAERPKTNFLPFFSFCYNSCWGSRILLKSCMSNLGVVFHI
jgi:hypothetical protein